MKGKTTIASMRHRVILCSQQDVVTAGGDLSLNRNDVAEMWANIVAKAASTFSPQGAAMEDPRNRRTHIITVRQRSDLNISVMAWVYEARLSSPPRWFKVLRVNQTEGYGSAMFDLECRLIERGDDIAEPDHASSGPVVALPHGVAL